MPSANRPRGVCGDDHTILTLLKKRPKHSVYSFRHAFKDRLKAAECPEEMVDELMGHTTGKPKYGDGYGLLLKARYMQSIALTPA
jgi:hypothetical protein